MLSAFSFGEHRPGRDLMACVFQSPSCFQFPSFLIHWKALLLWMIVASNSKWPCAVERCTTLELLEKVASFSVDHHWNGRRHTFCQQLLWIFGRTGALKLQTHVSFTPCWGGMCASALPKMRVNGSSSSLLSASPFFLGAVTTEMLFFIFIGFIGDGLHTAWVCKPGVCSSFCYIFFF